MAALLLATAMPAPGHAEQWTLQTRLVPEHSMVTCAHGGGRPVAFSFDLEGDVLHFANQVNEDGWSTTVDAAGNVSTSFVSSSSMASRRATPTGPSPTP